ncbi:hypothetical protein PchlO6_4909 [Pseudomonas chlororaphis O6]|uniref:Uncharacterized protein n=1 Tax=Pseudomonas chlororaphis O6 TaxID=1037915 RepID=A0AB33WK90_9PSED|nr:hypothetical protein PchlO6_4909 [Pseudomonas chlororaphis O6]
MLLQAYAKWIDSTSDWTHLNTLYNVTNGPFFSTQATRCTW